MLGSKRFGNFQCAPRRHPRRYCGFGWAQKHIFIALRNTFPKFFWKFDHLFFLPRKAWNELKDKEISEYATLAQICANLFQKQQMLINIIHFLKSPNVYVFAKKSHAFNICCFGDILKLPNLAIFSRFSIFLP